MRHALLLSEARPAVSRSRELFECFSSFDFLFLPQEEASKAMGKKTLEGVTNEKETESQVMEEKAGGHV